MSKASKAPKTPTAETLPSVPFPDLDSYICTPPPHIVSPLDDCSFSSARRHFYAAAYANNENLASALDSLGRYPEAQRVRDCHRKAFPRPGAAGKFIFLWPCKNRLCWFCKGNRSRRIQFKYASRAMAMVDPYWVTLTFRNTPFLNKRDLSRFRQTLSKFRRRKLVRDRCRGGLSILDIPHDTARGFNPHFHLLLDLAQPITKSALGREWHAASGNFQVHITPVPSSGDMKRVFGYMTRPLPDHSPATPMAIGQFVEATFGQQMFRALGNCVGNTEKRTGKPGLNKRAEAGRERRRVSAGIRRDRAAGGKWWKA